MIINSLFNIVNNIVRKDVKINWNKVEELAKQMIEDGCPQFGENQAYHTGIFVNILKELIASSINYCYWYGTHDIRPNNVSSTSMYNDVEKVFANSNVTSLNFDARIYHLIELLSKHRYPLLEERKRHLLDLCVERKAEVFAHMIQQKEMSGEESFNILINKFSGFSSDTFLKRASLFFIQLNRIYGWYAENENDLMYKLPVPADYQVPKILRHFLCLEYSNNLSSKINNNELIAKHSFEEIQIRAATIKVCEELKRITKWTIADVDTYLWTKRKITNVPFHLTITSDY